MENQIEEITKEILELKQSKNFIEIGKKLIKAKALLNHGEFTTYLKEIDLTARTAQRYIKISQEFGNSETIKNLGTAKLYALSELSPEDREEFLCYHNNIEDMSVREIKKYIGGFEMEKKKYYTINKKYLAFSIAFLGFQYFIFDKEDGSKAYSFKDTPDFRRALNSLLKLKKEFEWNFEYENQN